MRTFSFHLLRVWIPFVATGALLALLIPAIYQSREQAHRQESRQNLNQFGLALYNYHDTWGCFPPGGAIGSDGTAFHGWLTCTLPFIDGSGIYSQIDLAQPWDSERNAHLFATQIPMFRIPGAADEGATHLYGLLHYPGNPNVFHRNHSIRIDELTAGTSHSWLLGEAAGNYSPWGYPFNWRRLGDGLNTGPEGFGRPTGEGDFFLMADGSTTFISNDVDRGVLTALREAPPVAAPSATERPPWPEHYRHSAWKLVNVDREAGDLEALVDEKGVPRRVRIATGDKLMYRNATVSDLREIVKHFPRVRWIAPGPAVDDETAKVLAELSELETLDVSDVNVTDAGLRALQSLRRLRTLRVSTADEKSLERLREALPECDVSVW